MRSPSVSSQCMSEATFVIEFLQIIRKRWRVLIANKKTNKKPLTRANTTLKSKLVILRPFDSISKHEFALLKSEHTYFIN